MIQDKTEQTSVSIVIPCRNEIKHIGECIDAVLNQEDKNILDIEVIIVDADSTDGSVDFIKSNYGDRVKVIRNEKIFTPFAFNKGIRNSAGEYVIIVGPRNIMSSNYILSCLAVLKKDPQIACVGGYTINMYSNNTSESIALAMNSKIGVGFSNFRTVKESGYVDTVGTPMFRREIFDKIGYFDERLVRNQDDDFSFRLINAGYKIWLNADAHMKYYVRTSFKNLTKQYFQYGYWKIFVNKKHKTITTSRQVIPALFVLFVALGYFVLYLLHLGFLYKWILLFYLIVVVFSSFAIGKKISRVPTIVYSIVLLHFSYGLGYLNGILDFFILNKKPAEKATALSR
ncbi:MAG TPA: glycosyltransferase family 2 protein [Flavipsychrobacter sp.]|nr:glycosyltransferase family 2 protein [Flavipsychrobacter sp.]